MKILRFDLIAFGHFSGQSLDLSHGREGIQLIYGANEAGKSTALRALRAAFYGIDPRSTDNFLHEHDRMRVGARVCHADGSECEFIRRKGTKNTFLDVQGNPADESVLRRCLAGVDAQLFATLFGINHQQMVLGGDSMLKGRGDVGQSLFAAGSGAIDLREVLDGLDAEAADLFRTQGQNQVINRAVKQYVETKKEISEVSLMGRDYEERLASVERLRGERDRIVGELQRLRAETNRLDRIGRSLAPIAERRALLADLAQIGEVVVLPEGFSQEHATLIATLANARAGAQRCSGKVKDIEGKIADLHVPEQLLGSADLIADLHQRLGSHRKAARDLPGLQGELTALEMDAKRLVEEVRPGFPFTQVESLRLSRVRRVKIQDLGNKHQALSEQPGKLSAAHDAARAKLFTVTDRLAKLGAAREPADLRAAIRRAQKEGDLEAELASARAGLVVVQEKAMLDLKRLGLWSGTLEGLERFPVPAPETIDRFDAQWSSLENETANLAARIFEEETQLGDHARGIEELMRSGAIPNEAELDQARRHRDAGWQLVRQAWLDHQENTEQGRAFAGEKPLADVFEASVELADAIADRLRREADRVAKRAALTASHDQCAQAVSAAKATLEQRKAEIRDLEKAWAALWQVLTPLPPREMRPWIQKQVRLVEQAADLRARSSRCDDLALRIGDHRNQLRVCLEGLGEQATEGSLTLLLEHTLRAVEAIDRIAREREQLEEEIATLTENLRTMDEAKQRAEQALTDWQGEWMAAVSEIGLPGTGTPSQANAVLAGYDELFQKVARAASLRSRVEAIDADAKVFHRDVTRAVDHIAGDLHAAPPEEAVTELHARHARASKEAATLAAFEKQRDDAAQELEDANRTIQNATSRLETMCHEAHCDRPDELEGVEWKSAQVQTKRRRLEELNQRLLTESAGMGIEDFVRQAETVDGDTLGAQIVENQRTISELENKRSEADNKLGGDEALLRTMDGTSRAAEAAERLQSTAAEIQEHAARYARLRLAAAILRREIERYRAENQDPMLRRASEYFRQLTCGSFDAIATDFDAADEAVLRGVRSSGARVGVEHMSDGSRDQLFFALQLSSVERFVDSNGPIPLIVDDVLIGFDNERATAVLRSLESLSRKTQVIMFTHHRHLVDLARAVLPNEVLQVHELLSPPSDAWPRNESEPLRWR